jgi:hypothetical protein
LENKKEQPCAAFYNLRKYYLYPKRIRKKEINEKHKRN